jgi:class 3 adenylate cyclase
VTLGPFVARMSVETQAVYTVFSILLYNGLDAAVAGSALPIRASMSVTLLSMGAIGTVLAHQLERHERESFAQRRLIQRQVAELDAEKKRSEELLLNVLPKNIAERLKNDDEPIADGFSRVSVLFADIVGFTQMTSQIPPEELVRRLNRVFSSFDDLSDELKLEKIKTIGDCYMVAAGLHSHEYDHAQTIAEMALAMQRRIRSFGEELGEPLSLRIGIHTGPVVAGVIGKRKFIYDVWGDTVNTASRMESHSEPGKIQVTKDTHALLEGRYDFEPRGEIEIKGKGKMSTWFLVGPLGSKKDPGMRETQLPRRVDAS